jgi:hypothetical protein
MALSPEQIRSIYAKRRTKGLYTELLGVFIESGENGVSVREQWPTQFAWDESKDEGERGKQASTLKQGFENAKDRKDAPEGSDAVDVIVDGEDVFLINRSVMDLTEELVGTVAQ